MSVNNYHKTKTWMAVSWWQRSCFHNKYKINFLLSFLFQVENDISDYEFQLPSSVAVGVRVCVFEGGREKKMKLMRLPKSTAHCRTWAGERAHRRLPCPCTCVLSCSDYPHLMPLKYCPGPCQQLPYKLLLARLFTLESP